MVVHAMVSCKGPSYNNGLNMCGEHTNTKPIMRSVPDLDSQATCGESLSTTTAMIQCQLVSYDAWQQ